MNAPILYEKHYDVRLPPVTHQVPLDAWIATGDKQTREGRLYYTAGAVRWPTNLSGVASATLPFEFDTQKQACEAAQQFVAFLKTIQS